VPRVRSIKPEFWTDGDVVQMSPYARLLFIGSWNFALCDAGHVKDDPTRLKLQVLPMDDVDPAALIEECVKLGRLTRINLGDGRTFLHIKRFSDHQYGSPKWNPRCPVCKEIAPEKPSKSVEKVPEPSTGSSDVLDFSGTVEQVGKGREGKKDLSTSKLVDDKFQAFWSAYPRKVARGAAVKSWGAAIKRGAEPDRVIAAVVAFAVTVSGKDAEYVPHASTWLNQERYDDEPAANAATDQRRRHDLPLEVPAHIDPNDPRAYADWANGAAS
jgi:hypothetical protein